MNENVLLEKSYQFALRIVKSCRYLNDEKHACVLSKQILVSGTSNGSQAEEAQPGENRPDFLHRISIAGKHACKTNYWRRLLHDSEYLNERQFGSLSADREELRKILTATLGTTGKTLEN